MAANEHEPKYVSAPQQLIAATGSALVGMVMLFIAGSIASNAGLGGAIVRRSCSGDLMWAALFLPIAGASFGIAGVSLRWRPAARLHISLQTAAATALPLIVIALLALPAFLGCRLGSDIANIAVIGDSLAGAPGFLVFGAAALTSGFATVACCWWDTTGLPAREPTLVEQVLAQQEAGELVALEDLSDAELEELEELEPFDTEDDGTDD